MWKTFTRPAMIFVPFLLGMLFPEAHALNDPPYEAVRWLLTAMVLTSCLQIDYRALRPRAQHWRILGLNLLMGVAPYLLLRWLWPENRDLALAAFFVGVTPTATAAPVVVAFLHGRIGFALTGFTITNVFVSVALLGLLPWVTGNLNLEFAGRVGATLLQVIALPFALSLVLRWLWPGARDLPKRPRAKTFTFLMWSFLLFVLAAIARQYFIDHPGAPRGNVALIGAASLALCAVNFWLGRRLAPYKYRRESSQLLGQKNTSFSMYLALSYAGPLVAMGPIFYVLWHNSWNAWQMFRYDRRRFLRRRAAGGEP